MSFHPSRKSLLCINLTDHSKISFENIISNFTKCRNIMKEDYFIGGKLFHKYFIDLRLSSKKILNYIDEIEEKGVFHIPKHIDIYECSKEIKRDVSYTLSLPTQLFKGFDHNTNFDNTVITLSCKDLIKNNEVDGKIVNNIIKLYNSFSYFPFIILTEAKKVNIKKLYYIISLFDNNLNRFAYSHLIILNRYTSSFKNNDCKQKIYDIIL